jgi:hypothetical protein
MKKEKIILFKWKFLPGRESRKCPDSRKIDYDDPYQLLKWRQDVRLWVHNWRNVWYTYSYLLNYYPYFGLAVWLISGSWIAGLATLALYIPMYLFIRKKISFLDQLEIVMPAMIDPLLTPLFGSLPKFSYGKDQCDGTK